MAESAGLSVRAAADREFPVVGVGASAGGLEAFIEFLRGLPPRPGMAFVLIQHLDPNHPSLLTEILARETPISVTQATDDQTVEPDHIYVIPPNSNIAIEGGRLRLTPRAESAGVFMPIDHFLRSLAHDQGSRAAAIILSGGGTDGALGLSEVKASDGVTFVQSERSAKHEAMPRNAIATGAVDFVLDPAEIARELVRVTKNLNGDIKSLGKSAEEELRNVFSTVRSVTGADFSQYKPTTMRRRIQRRMALVGASSLSDYIALLKDKPAEVTDLYRDFLIQVTSFFRDPEAFTALQQKVLPRIIRDRPPDSPLRIWVAGCSTGEEVYSLAIALMESLGDMAANTFVKILATDISEAALERARAGMYVDNIAMDVSQERLRRFFVQINGHYQVSKSIRDLCVFSKHNLIKDTPFANLDLVSCRNVLIYLDLPLQKRVLPLFHYALKPSGTLMLGTSETIGTFTDLFTVLDKDNRIYTRRDTPTRAVLDIVMNDKAEFGPKHSARQRSTDTPERESDIQREVDHILLTRFVPAGVVIDEDMIILSFRGQVGPYLNPSPGAASLDLSKLIRDGLGFELRAAVAAVKASDLAVHKERVQVRENGHFRYINIDVVPVQLKTPAPKHYLVLFSEARGGTEPEGNGAAVVPADESTLQKRIRELEREITINKENLQSVIEENESTTEELKSAHEEILSSNEELQSTNEELQTAKEEMQSTNEELATVNDELNHRNGELTHVNDDLVNLLAGLDIPVVIVNRDLRIRRFTQPAESLFNLIPSDINRPISHLRPKLTIPNLDALISDVIRAPAAKSVEAQDTSGKWYLLRIRPYITTENKIDGAAISAFDIDAMKRASEQLKSSLDYADAIVETVGAPLVVVDRNLIVKRVNAAFYRAFNAGREQIEGHPFYEIQDRRWSDKSIDDMLRKTLGGEQGRQFVSVEVELPKLGLRNLQINARRIDWAGIDSPMLLIAIEDVTDRNRELEQARLLASEQAARAEAEAANRTKDEFMAMLAHELRNPLAPIRSALGLLELQFNTNPVAARAIEISQRQITHMARLLDDLLDVSRITRGKIHLRMEIVELRESVTGFVETNKHAIESRRHKLVVELPKEPVYVEADPPRLDQIISNLVNNAVKYTEPGGQITIKLETEGDDALVRVRDTGIGLAPEMLARIFDPFTQVSHSLDRSQGGLGIGLTLVRRLVELHGGSVSANSAGLGKGSEFVVRLPQMTPAAKPSLPPALPRHSENPSRRILVVDDNDDAAEALAIMLRGLGHVVETAHDGPAALKVVETFNPDVGLLDLGLPGMDGFELAKRLRQVAGLAKILLVAITGYGQEDMVSRSRMAGFDHHLVKPVALEALNQILSTAR
jgi:two-component system CheB/CheR fusion protein